MGSTIVGETLLGQFRVDAFIASGGMGAVYRVWDLKRNVPLAMKVLHADLADDHSILKRFQREARALQRLAHPNIVPFYGLFQAGDLASLLERFIDGPSLKDILRSRKDSPLPVDEALVYLKAVSSALGYAHAHGVVHCDVKPGNVMVDRGGSVYLTDFGVARHAESTTTTLGFAGTAGYMAPEQIRGHPVSPATDVYALGVMLYEMLTGERPFRGDEPETEGHGSSRAERVRWAHLHLAPADPRQRNPRLPEGLARVILKSMAKAPAERFETAREFYSAGLALCGISEAAISQRAPKWEFSRAHSAAPPRTDGAAIQPHAPQARDSETGTKSKSRIVVAVGGAAAIIVMVVGGLAFLGPNRPGKLVEGASSESGSGSSIAASPPVEVSTPQAVLGPTAKSVSSPTPTPRPTLEDLTPTTAPLEENPIGPEAVWDVPANALSDLQSCLFTASNASSCMESTMRRMGASEAAIRFAERLGWQAILVSFKEQGRVDIGTILYPTAANDNLQTVMLNSLPAVILASDASDLTIVSAPGYNSLPGDRSNLWLWPSESRFEVAQPLPAGGQRFVLSAPLYKGCHACGIGGYALIAFDFDSGGYFLGKAVLALGPTKPAVPSP